MPEDGHAATPNGQLVREFLAAMGRMDIDSVSGLLAEDATWWMQGDLPVSGLYEGKTAVVEGFLASAAGLFEPGSLSFEVRRIFEDADSVVVEYTGSGIGLADGQQYRNSYCTIFMCRDRLISSVREYLDTAHVRDVLYPMADA